MEELLKDYGKIGTVNSHLNKWDSEFSFLVGSDRKTSCWQTYVRHNALNTLPETPGHVLNDFMRLDE